MHGDEDHGVSARVGFTSVQPWSVLAVPSGGAGTSPAIAIAVGGRGRDEAGDAAARSTTPAARRREGCVLETSRSERRWATAVFAFEAVVHRHLALRRQRVKGDDGEQRKDGTRHDPGERSPMAADVLGNGDEQQWCASRPLRRAPGGAPHRVGIATVVMSRRAV